MPADRRFPSRRSVRLFERPPPNYKESSPEKEENENSAQQDSVPAAPQTDTTIVTPPPASMALSLASTTRSSPPASASTPADLSSNEHEDEFEAALACFLETQFSADVASIRGRCLHICNVATAAWKALTVAEREQYFNAAKHKQTKDSREQSSVAQDDGRVAKSPTPPMLMPADWSDPQSRSTMEKVYGLEEAQRLEGSVSMHAPPHQSKSLLGGSRSTRSRSLSDLPNPPPEPTAMTTTWSDAGYRFPEMSSDDADWLWPAHLSNSLVGSARTAKTRSLPDVFTQAAESSSSATVGNATLSLSEQSFPAASNDNFAQGSNLGWTITENDKIYKPPTRSNSHSRRRGDDHIPRPPNSSMLFRSEYWKEQKANASERNHREVSRAAARDRARHELSEAGRGHYQQLADRLKADLKRQYPGYKFSPEHRKGGDAAKPAIFMTRQEWCNHTEVGRSARMWAAVGLAAGGRLRQTPALVAGSRASFA
ncbi:uncharacterized protein SCHCODRAFT_02516391 [Schizophyllum commune H4-8]|uniref:uncharacterized protein n=1 Tax=Schizophyllum commune (strain H4-8 / FGSC 9210) TaxID=578458 RepID=UPI00215FBC6A|nr:uncharacterized protein SCHCODRAFT_02513725 [Schizophyllum commune H4-8]XP_050198036.1 uncharacterized protein SCHCODRAFT_02516391 [Schizophyllum commune H4-8]KAI5887351.1 hypothetical protein SCHCODRAFT_02516391 [Schizophyllum commune H4-8]KAI5888894.1 hypothetical protein SCHCODRAFT_02513725 [Schizophyllum commune H4-8]